MKNLYLICNSHIDPVWLWERKEGMASAVSTFKSAVELLKKHDFIFCHNESVLYEYIEKVAPDLFEEIRKLVKQGKWRIIGGWYLQPDCLMPCGETFVRHINIGKKYFREKFGIDVKVAANFDSFGHTRGLVQILKKSGYTGYLVCRPHFDYWPVSSDFINWIGLDGSAIKTIRDKFHYSNTMGELGEKIKNEIEYYSGIGKDEGLCLWGVGNHGGGASESDLKEIEELRAQTGVNLVHSYPEQAFEEIKAEVDYDKSLITVHQGCYTSNRDIKERFSELENLLLYVEKVCSLGELYYGIPYPTERINEIFKNLLECSFHDILPGTCSEKGTIYAVNLLSRGISAANELLNENMAKMLTPLKRAPKNSLPVFVFNPMPYRRKFIAECDLMLHKIYSDKTKECIVKVFDENGGEVKSQKIRMSANFNVDWQIRIAVECDIEAFSFGRYYVEYEFIEKKIKQKPQFEGLDNIAFYVFDDNEDPWGMSPEQYVRMGSNGKEILCCGSRVIEHGDLYTSVEKQYSFGRSLIVLAEKHYKGSNRADLFLRVYWNEQNKMLKMGVKTGEGEYIGQTAFGTNVLYNDGRECCGGYFTAVRRNGKVYGIINNGVYGSSYKSGEVFYSLLRSGAYAAHVTTDGVTGERNDLVDYSRFNPPFDNGMHIFEFGLFPDADEAVLDSSAAEFNQKPYALYMCPIGDKESTVPDMDLSNRDITLVTIKKSETVNGYVIRLLNNYYGERHAKFAFKGANVDLRFGRYEVKTLLYENGALREVYDLIV